MPQFALPFKYEEETKSSGLTGLAGLPLYLELQHSLNISKTMRVHLDAGISEKAVWKPSEIVQSLILLNLAGGEHVDDLRNMEADAGKEKIGSLWTRFANMRKYVSSQILWRLPKRGMNFVISHTRGWKINSLQI